MIERIATSAAMFIAGVLTASSIHNAAQTVLIAQVHADRYMSDTNQMLQDDTTTTTVVKKLQTMKRKELLELFKSSEIPSRSALPQLIQGEYDGCLLNNNGLTKITEIITNGLFGRGRQWNGKSFGEKSTGINRFRSKELGSTTETEHMFRYDIGPSTLHPDKESIRLDYGNFQSPWSLWKTMKDEVRVAAVNDDGNLVLIGMGCMAWSGGFWNASPFCLYTRK